MEYFHYLKNHNKQYPTNSWNLSPWNQLYDAVFNHIALRKAKLYAILAFLGAVGLKGLFVLSCSFADTRISYIQFVESKVEQIF